MDVVYTLNIGKGNCNGYISFGNFLLKYVLEAKIEGTRGRRRRPKQILCDMNEMTGQWKMKQKALGGEIRRIRLEEATDLT